MEKYYLDASVWIDYLEAREDKFRPLGEWALQLLKTIIANNDLIIYSQHLINELENVGYNEKKIRKEVFDIVKDNIVEVQVSGKQINAAYSIAIKRSLPKGDVLHALIARDNNAVMVSRDKHFSELQDIVVVKKPEDLI